MALLTVKGLTKYFGGLRAVYDLSFEVQPGEILGLIGPNGAGKTTAFNLIAGFIRPTSGRVLLDGENIAGMKSYAVTRKGIARTFQIVKPFRKLTVLETADLVKQLETKWGVSASAPVAVAAGPAAGAAPVAEVKTTFDVILISVAAEKKIAVIKAVREVKAGLGLADAKALVEGAPKPVLEGAAKADAEAAKKKLEDAGGKAELK